MTGNRDRIAAGKLARLGLLDGPGIEAGAALLERVAQSRLETVRVLFADPHGVLRGKTVVASALASVLADGLAAPSTLLFKDTANRTVFPVWSAALGPEAANAADLLLAPDPASFRILPWSPTSAWLLCDPYWKSGAPIPISPRGTLRRAVAKLAERGLALTVGLEVEFHVFERLDAGLEHGAAGLPGAPVRTRNLGQGYQFLGEAQYDQLEPVMDALRRDAQALGLPVRSTEVEMGPSQFEFTFDPADPMTHADTMVMFRTMVKETCARRGLHATFMCRPRVENAAASGWHLHQSLCDLDSGRNRMMPEREGAVTELAGQWIAGLLEHAAAACLLTTPTVNGYKRYRPHQLAPDRIQWGRDNRGAMIRGLMAPGDAASRIENRVAEPAANPYYVFASQILAGLDGITRGLRAPEPVETPYDTAAPALPESLLSAIRHFDGSTFFRAALGEGFVDHLVTLRRAEWDRYHLAISEWEQSEYFNLF